MAPRSRANASIPFHFFRNRFPISAQLCQTQRACSWTLHNDARERSDFLWLPWEPHSLKTAGPLKCDPTGSTPIEVTTNSMSQISCPGLSPGKSPQKSGSKNVRTWEFRICRWWESQLLQVYSQPLRLASASLKSFCSRFLPTNVDSLLNRQILSVPRTPASGRNAAVSLPFLIPSAASL